MCGEKNMNIYSISISHGKNSSHITYIRLNHPWSINRLRTKALDWLREWLTAERVEPLNVKLKGKMGSVFVQVPRGEKPGFCTHTYTRTRAYAHALTAHVHSHIVILLYFGLCSTWKHFMLPAVWDELGVALQQNIRRSAGGQFRVEQVQSYPSSASWPWWNMSFFHFSPCFLSLSLSHNICVCLFL